MPNVLIRRWSLIAAVVLIAASFFINKKLSSMKKPPQQKGSVNTTPVVEVLTVDNQSMLIDIPITGKLVSKNRIEVFSEVTGKLLSTNKPFKEGTFYNRGETLLKLDASDYRMSLIANRSSFQSLITQLLADLKIDYPDNFQAWKDYTDNFDPKKSIPALPEVSNKQERSFLVSRNVFNQFYAIKSQQAQLDKYTLTAPFSGIVSEANVTPGSVIRANQPVGQFLDPYLFELEVGVSIYDINKIQVGSSVSLTSDAIPGEWDGKITRISQSVDEATQTVKAYIEVYGKELFEGLYLKASIDGVEVDDVTQIPSNLVFDNNRVYLVRDSKLETFETEIIHKGSDYFIVKGIPEGELLLNQVLAGASDGVEVKIASN